MIVRFTLVGSTVLTLLSVPAAAASPSSGWGYETSAGSVHVLADRKHITVCDSYDDGYTVEAEYATSMLGTYTVPDSNSPWAGCGTDSTFFSRIDVFKLCTTHQGQGVRACAESVWIKRPLAYELAARPADTSVCHPGRGTASSLWHETEARGPLSPRPLGRTW